MSGSRSGAPCEGCGNREAGRCPGLPGFLTRAEPASPEETIRLAAQSRGRRAAHP